MPVNLKNQKKFCFLCVFGTCRAFDVPAEVFDTWCLHADFFGLKSTFLMIRRMSKTGGIKFTCQVVKLGAGAE